MFSKKKNPRYNSLTYNMFVPISIVLTITSVLFQAMEEYVFILRIICFSISFVIFIMSIIKITDKDLGIFKYIGIGYFYISILGFASLKIFEPKENDLVTLIMHDTINYLYMINIIIGMVFYKNNYSKKIQNVVLILIIPILFFVIRNQYYNLFIIEDISSMKKQVASNQLILFILFMLIVYYYKKMKIGKSHRWIIYVGLLAILGDLFILLSSVLDNNVIIFLSGIKCYSYFIVYDKLEETLLVNTFEHAYEGLIKSKQNRVKLNKKLKKRERELKELKLILEKSEREYYHLVQAFSDGLIIFENDIVVYSNCHKEMYYNKDSESMYSYNELKLNSVLKGLTSKEYPDDSDISDFTTEVSILNKFDQNKILEISLMKIYDNRKILMFNDITKLVEKRKEMIEYGKKINNENIRDEFYSNISHELKTPINVISSALQLNDVYFENNELQKVYKNNYIVKQNCLRLVRTINNFIDSNKLLEGFLDVDKKLYNIVDIIENVVLLCNSYMKLKETKLTFDTQYEEIYFYCDKNYIERIMLNILSNSLKYGKHGGNIYILLAVDNKEGIIIEVINDAEAIPEDKRIIIFDKFTKMDTSLNRSSEGSGLGLYLTKGLVGLHDGTITLSAGIKYGNIFKITLPYNHGAKEKAVILNNDLEINELQEKVDMEFSDIYF